MNYLAIDKFSTSNGEGIRTVLWLSGCTHKCYGCHNPESWNKNNGRPFINDTLYELNTLLKNPYNAGLTISGGDPFENYNLPDIVNVVTFLKTNHPNKTIWAYTGYLYETLLINNHPLLPLIDILVDGPFKVNERDITLPFKGSSNQRIIDVQQSLKENKIILWESKT